MSICHTKEAILILEDHYRRKVPLDQEEETMEEIPRVAFRAQEEEIGEVEGQKSRNEKESR